MVDFKESAELTMSLPIDEEAGGASLLDMVSK